MPFQFPLVMFISPFSLSLYYICSILYIHNYFTVPFIYFFFTKFRKHFILNKTTLCFNETQEIVSETQAKCVNTPEAVLKQQIQINQFINDLNLIVTSI